MDGPLMTVGSQEEDLKPPRWKPRRKSFSLRRLRKSFSKENLPPSETVSVTRAAGDGEEVPGLASDAQDVLLTPNTIMTVPTKRKTAASPVVIKKKYFRRVSLPFMPHSSARLSASFGVETRVASPSAFEQELLSREDESPNDPEFIRRASQRWKSKTMVPSSHLRPLNVLEHAGDNYKESEELLSPFQRTVFQWPTCPSQQSAFQRPVSSKSVQYMELSLCGGQSTSCQDGTRLRRCARRWSSVAFRPHHQKYSTVRPTKTTSRGYNSNEQVKDTEKTNSWLSFPVRRRFSFTETTTRTQESAHRLVLDGSGATEATRAAERTKHLVQEEVPVPGKQSRSLTVLSLRSLGQRLRKSFRGPSAYQPDSQPKSSHRSCARPPSHTSSFTSSSSYHSSLSGMSYGYCQVPSSISPTSSNYIILTSSVTLPSLATSGDRDFKDIFVSEPQIAEKCAIMFPSEPRPEWHRHLRQVLQKAGQKIFKKPEYHDTNIPEHLRHQLKHIYVY